MSKPANPPRLNRHGTAPVRPTRGRPPKVDGEESCRVSVAVGSTLHSKMQDAALKRGLERKERGAEYFVANLSAAGLVAFELLVELDALNAEGALDAWLVAGTARKIPPEGLGDALRKALAAQPLQ